MELTILGVNVLLLMAVWHFMIKRTILDHTRDKLFDLRDELRSQFVSNGWDMGSPLYKKLRDLLNGHLRFTEEYSIWKLAFIKSAINHDKELQFELHEKFEKMFAIDDITQRTFILSLRARAMATVTEFSVFSSGFLLCITALVTPFVVMFKVFDVINRGFGVASKVCFRSMRNFGRVSTSMLESAARIVAKQLVAPDWLEGYSYRIGIA